MRHTSAHSPQLIDNGGPPFVIPLTIPGTIGTGTNQARYRVPGFTEVNRAGYAYTLSEIYIFLGTFTASSGSNTFNLVLTDDSNDNLGTIGTLSLAHGTQYGYLDLRSSAYNQILPGQSIRLDVTAIAGTAPAAVTAQVTATSVGIANQ